MANEEWRDDPKLVKALDDSIEHWDRLANGRRYAEEGIDSHSCALCAVVFRRNDSWWRTTGTKCTGCPIAEATGEPYCNGSPWQLANDALKNHQRNFLSPGFMSAASKMLNFLKELRGK